MDFRKLVISEQPPMTPEEREKSIQNIMNPPYLQKERQRNDEQLRDSMRRYADAQEWQKERQKQAYLEALREHEAEKQPQKKETVLNDGTEQGEDSDTPHIPKDDDFKDRVAHFKHLVEKGSVNLNPMVEGNCISLRKGNLDIIYNAVMVTKHPLWNNQKLPKNEPSRQITMSAFNRDLGTYLKVLGLCRKK